MARQQQFVYSTKVRMTPLTWSQQPAELCALLELSKISWNMAALICRPLQYLNPTNSLIDNGYDITVYVNI